MKPESKSDILHHISRTYWSFWCWLILSVLAVINMILVPSMFAICVILLDLYVMITRYQEHKELRAEYDRRYSWAINSSVDQSKETE